MALYIALTLTTPWMSFQVVQLRLAEVLTALPALFPSAIPGVFAGCLVSNILNPSPLGLVDIICGSATTLCAAFLTWIMAKPLRQALARMLQEGNPLPPSAKTCLSGGAVPPRGYAAPLPKREEDGKGSGKMARGKRRLFAMRFIPLLPPVVLNALVVGTYLPYLLSEGAPGIWFILGTIGSIFLSQAVVVWGLGLPLIMSLERTPWAKRIYLVGNDALLRSETE